MDQHLLLPRRGADAAPHGEQSDQLLGLIHWLSAASRQLRRRLADVAASCELSDGELLVIWLCHGAGNVQVDLAAAIGVSPAQMSGLVERLGQRGLVAMNRSVRDRRRQVWRTSAAGEALLGQVAAPLANLTAALGRQVDSAEQALAQSLCQRLASAAAQQAQDEQRCGKEAA
ncbi:MAG TPA: MarR family winged helix-turn-helix transcriptional regulator [Pirellulaceae bacterium]|nr:MarR family winged helix-turn-helix transcriptional regulator [Pirellulaceae bacterium]